MPKLSMLGVWVAYAAFIYIVAYVSTRLGYVEDSSRASQPADLLLLLHGFAQLFLALYLLLGTRHLAWLCYEKGEPLKLGNFAPELPPERDFS